MKKTEHIIMLFLAMTLLAISPQRMWAEEGQSRPSELFSKDGFSYCWSSESSHTLKLRDVDVSLTGANIVIPSTVEYNGDTCTVITLAYCCFRDRTGIDTITIPASVKYIDMNAFHNCDVKKLVFEDSTEEMQNQYDNLSDDERGMFYFCSSLTEVYLGRSINGEYESHPVNFESNKYLTKLTIGPGVTYIGKYLIENSTVTDLDFSNATALAKICGHAFNNCPNLTRVDMTGATSLASIEEAAFQNSSNITTVKFPPSLTHIYENAFYDGESGTTIPDSVYFFGDPASGSVPCECDDVNSLQNATYVYLDRNVWISGTKVFPNCTTMLFGSNVTSVAGRCFEDAKITSLYIPKNITNIGYKSFYDCGNLTFVDFEDTSTPITFTTNDDNESDAFGSCESLVLTNIGRNISYSTSALDDEAFDITLNMGISPFWDSYLANVVIGDSVTELLPYLFEDCNDLASITIGSNVKTIGYGVFKDCDNLVSVSFSDGKDSVTIMPWAHFDALAVDYTKRNPFDDCPLTSFYMGRNIVDGRGTGYRITNNDNASELSTISVGQYVTKVPGWIFRDCTSLSFLDIRSDSVVIETGAFDNCNGLLDLTIDGAATIQTGAFKNCTSLKTVSFLGTPTICENAFLNCTAIDSILVRYYADPTTDAGPETSFPDSVYVHASLTNIADNKSFSADFSQTLPWSKFTKRGTYVGTAVAEFSADDETMPQTTDVATISFNHDFLKGGATGVLVPFTVDSYYFGSDATIYSIATEAEGSVMNADTFCIQKLDISTVDTLPANKPLIVIAQRGDTLVQAQLDMFKSLLLSFYPTAYNGETDGLGVSSLLQKTQLEDVTSSYTYTIADGFLKRVNSTDYTIPAYSVMLSKDDAQSLSLADATTGEKILPDGFDVTPSQQHGGYVPFYTDSTDCEVVAVSSDGTTVTPAVYTVTSQTSTSLTLHKVADGVINKGQGVIIKGTEGVPVHLRAVTSPSTDTDAYTSNLLKDADADLSLQLIFDDDPGTDPTAVRILKASSGTTETYDLGGRKVTQKRSNHIYISDNRKTVKK